MLAVSGLAVPGLVVPVLAVSGEAKLLGVKLSGAKLLPPIKVLLTLASGVSVLVPPIRVLPNPGVLVSLVGATPAAAEPAGAVPMPAPTGEEPSGAIAVPVVPDPPRFSSLLETDSYVGRDGVLRPPTSAIRSTSLSRLVPSSWVSNLCTAMSKHSDCSSRISTLKDSGVPGRGIALPFTIALSASFRPCISSDFTVSSSCKV